MKSNNDLNEKPKKYSKADKLTFCSIVLIFGITIIWAISVYIHLERFVSILFFISRVSRVIGLIILIYVRVKYPKHSLSQTVLSVVIILFLLSLFWVFSIIRVFENTDWKLP